MAGEQVSCRERVDVWMRKVWDAEDPTMALGEAGDAVSGAWQDRETCPGSHRSLCVGTRPLILYWGLQDT